MLLSFDVQTSMRWSVCAGHKKQKGNAREDSKSFFSPCLPPVESGAVLPMSKWKMTTSQAVSIRLDSAALGVFILVDSNMLLF